MSCLRSDENMVLNMSIKIYRLMYFTLVILLLVEVGLEFRAYYKGWNTILGKLLNVAPASEQGNINQVHFGPTKDFPFRSVVVPFEKDPKFSRLWIASSSYAQDNYLHPYQIFPNLLGAQLNQSDFPVQILNAAQEGQSIEGSVRVLKEIGKQWKPSYVLLYQMNLDINELSQQFCSDHFLRSITVHNTDQQKTSLNPKLYWGEPFIESTTVYQLLKENVTARISQSRILVQDIGEKARDAFRQRIYNFINTSRSIGAIPLLCTFATSHDRHHPGNIPAGVKDFLLRYNIYLSVSGWFNAIDQFNDDIRQIGKEKNVLVIDVNHYLSGKPEFFRDFVHFTPEGHKMMAQLIADKLVENRGLLLKAALNADQSKL